MDTRVPLFNWSYFCQGKTMEELRHSLWITTLELEQTRLAAQEELRKRDDELIQLQDLVNRAMKERDEAHEKCLRLLLEKHMFHQQQQQQQRQVGPHSGVSSIEDEPKRGIDSNNVFSSSDCEESIVSSPVLDPIQQPQLPAATPQPQQGPPQAPAAPPQSMVEASTTIIELVPEKPLPEKGKLLQAVMKAGPLLQTLLLAGPLPQWRHPPPPLESFEIPPVTIPSPPPPQLLHQDSLVTINGCNTLNTCGKVNRKRDLYDGYEYDSPTETKYQRLLLH